MCLFETPGEAQGLFGANSYGCLTFSGGMAGEGFAVGGGKGLVELAGC